jgi:tRNA guanosine-2'-O-methyltransferase
MDVDAVLRFLDEPSRLRAYEQCFSTLEGTPHLDLEALRVCIRLRPSLENAERLLSFLTLRIPQEPQDSERSYKLAEILLSDGPFAYALLGERLRAELVALLPELSTHIYGNEPSDEAECSYLDSVCKATAFLNLLKCACWLPSRHNHIIDPTTLEFLCRFIGLEAVDDVAHDTVSAFLSLLKRGESIVVVQPASGPQPWARYDSSLGQVVLVASAVDESVWHRFSHLGPQYFKTGGSKVFRTWFQWVSQVVTDGIKLDCLDENFYWDTIRIGLLTGYSDQRKYCIGIIRQSLLAARGDISTLTMRFAVADGARYLKIYEQYSSLFEIMVLDRYSNQVQACLPELTRLIESDITPVMATTLLSAALHPTVQESIRKIIGNWYMDYVVKVSSTLICSLRPLQIVEDGSQAILSSTVTDRVSPSIH